MLAVHVDTNSNIYILDADNHRVVKYSPGAVSGEIVAGGNGVGSNTNQLAYPYGMFMGSNASVIWIADTSNHRIVRWDSSANGVVVCGTYGTEASQFYFPYGLYVDTSAMNTLYVADTYNHRIQMWLPGATSGMTVAGQTSVTGDGLHQLNRPTAVIRNKNGHIFITDSMNSRILRWIIGETYGMIVAGDSTYGVLPNQLYYPYRTKFDLNGALIVVDCFNNRIQRFDVSCRKFYRCY